ncbi:retrovirus-related pol polyprotein from transposon TNT 1-94 [Tanacetum coccineum]
MTTLAEFMILSGVDNRPPMLEKHLYDSWKSIIELYMQNIKHGRMILELVEHGPLIWPTIEENRVTRTKKYEELSATEKIQADYDLKATNIILQGLPTDVYSLERECKLYDAFDKFAHIKEESLHQYYLRFTQLINDMNIYNMKLEQFQANTKFLNSLPPEWSKFVTDVKLVRDLHTTNFDQLHAYLEQHELHANEVLPQIDSGLAVPIFKQGDDPIDDINKMMSFLSTVVSSRFPTTNNQLRNSSNPRQQATIHDGRVTIQPVQGRQSSFAAGTSGTRANISGIGGNNSGQQRVVKCFNCQGEGHMARQCLKPKRKMDATWFRDKVLLVEAQGSDVLSEYSLETQNVAVQDANSSAQQDAMLERYKEWVKLLEERQNMDLSTREKLIMDDIIREKNAQFSDFGKEINYRKQTLFEQSKEKELLTKTFNVFKNESKEKEAKNIDKEIALEKKVKELDNIVYKWVNPQCQQIRPMIYDGSVIAKETNVISIADSEETLMLEEEKLSDEQAFRLQPSHPNTDQSASSPVKIEAPRELPKVSMVNTSLKKLKYHLVQFDNVVKKRIMLDALTVGEWGFEHTKAVFLKEIIPFVKTLKGIFNVFDKDLLNEVTEVQTVFNQMEAVVQQYHVDKQCFEIQKKQFLIEKDRLLDKIISQDIMNIVVNSSLDINTSVSVNSSVAMNDSMNYVEMCNKFLKHEAELIKQHNMVEKMSIIDFQKSFLNLNNTAFLFVRIT